MKPDLSQFANAVHVQYTHLYFNIPPWDGIDPPKYIEIVARPDSQEPWAQRWHVIHRIPFAGPMCVNHRVPYAPGYLFGVRYHWPNRWHQEDAEYSEVAELKMERGFEYERRCLDKANIE